MKQYNPDDYYLLIGGDYKVEGYVTSDKIKHGEQNMVSKKMIEMTLNEEEVRWLMGVMQNPLWDVPIEKELPQDSKMRKMFFETLKGEVDSWEE